MKAAIFDMDGTLLDSMGMWMGFAPSFVKKHALNWTKELAHTIKDMDFLQAADYFSEHYPQLGMTAEQLVAKWFETIKVSLVHEVFPKPSVLDYLKQLNRQGIPCAVATMTNHALADAALEHHGITALVSYVLTPEDVGGIGKDRPDIYLEAARRLQVPASQCVVFEDTLSAIETAVTAGFKVWAIDEPLQNERSKIRALCHRYIHNFSELLD